MSPTLRLRKKAFLSLGPEFAMYEPLSRKKAKKDFLIAATKIRWGRMGKPEEDIKHERSQEEVEKKIYLGPRSLNLRRTK